MEIDGIVENEGIKYHHLMLRALFVGNVDTLCVCQ